MHQLVQKLNLPLSPIFAPIFRLSAIQFGHVVISVDFFGLSFLSFFGFLYQPESINMSNQFNPFPLIFRPDKISGADINAICQEAGMQAVRENRYIVLPKDFEKGYKNNIKKDETEHEFYK